MLFRWRIRARACAILAACAVSYSVAPAGLKTGADFLKIPVGAEPAGLGQAYTALAQGVNSLNWNPAGIAKSPSLLGAPTLGISLSHQDHFSENSLDHLGLVVPARRPNRSTWGFDLIRLSYADQERRDENRQAVGSVGASDMAFGAAMAHDFGLFRAGTQLKFIHMELAGQRADGVALDLGFLARTPSPRLSLGFSARNIGPRMQFIHDKFDLPLTLSLGTAFRVTNPLTLACDIHFKPHQKQTVVSFGTEIVASRNVLLRAGYLTKVAEAISNTQSAESNRGNFGGTSGLAGGFGLVFQQFSLDYSITPFGELGNTQILTLSTWFGNSENQTPVEASPQTVTPTEPEPPSDRSILILPVSDEPWWNTLEPPHSPP